MRILKTRGLQVFFVLLIFLTASQAVMAFTISGSVKQKITNWIPEGAEVQLLEVDPLPGGAYDVNSIPIGTDTVNSKGDFTITFSWPVTGPGFDAGDPDIIFRITQMIDTGQEIIYQETPDQTRWNVSNGSNYNFILDSEYAIFKDPSINYSSVPGNSIVLFTRVGVIETATIDCIGWDINSTGYARARRIPYSYTGNYSDQPFGRTLNLFGWIGSSCDIDYYKVLYSSDGGTTWQELSTYLPNKWYDTSAPHSIDWTWVSQSMGPVEKNGIANLYKIPYREKPNTPWSFIDRLARFDTTLVPNGLIHIKIKGYVESGSSIIPATSSNYTLDTNYGDIVLKVDNTPPDVNIYQMKQNGSTVETCNVINLASGPLTIYFHAQDPLGHLMSYRLQAIYGDNHYVSPVPSGGQAYYSSVPGGPLWQGAFNPTAVYSPGVYTSTNMPTCAYQFRLIATKRTTNGYGLIYPHVEDTKHITIEN